MSATNTPLTFSRGKRDDPEAEQLRISVDEYEGRKYVSARIWFRTDAGEYAPTKKGVTVRSREIQDVILWLIDAEKVLGK